MAKAGAAGSTGSQGSTGASGSSAGNRSGPNSGQANGAGPGARPETNDFEREKPGAGSGVGRGQIVSAFTAEGEAERGDVRAPRSPEFAAAVRDLAEEVDSEPLPVEYKEIVEKYYESLLRGGTGGADGSADTTSPGDAPRGPAGGDG